MFNLEKAIRNWKRKLRNNPAFEDGDVAELESHLRDEIERLKAKGLTEEKAFRQAVKKIGEPGTIGGEMYKTKTPKKDATPPWKQKPWFPTLFPSYMKVAIRNFTKDGIYSSINILGLAVGIACSLLIFLFVIDELSYDTYHTQSDQIYRVAGERMSGGNEYSSAWSQVPMGPAIEENFSEVKEAIRFWRAFEPVVGFENDYFNEDNFYFSDPEVFTVFSFPLIKGNPETVLSQPGSIVITETAAQKLFGDDNPIGKTISYTGYPAGELEMIVTGVMEDIPSNSQFKFDFLATLVGIETEQNNWGSAKPLWTYLLLQPEAQKASLEQQLPAFLDSKTPSSSVTKQIALEPLPAVHLYSNYQGGFKAGGSITYIYLFGAIGFFILLIACINFINLSTARSLKRAAEVGVRKTLGAQRSQLIKQFLGETFVISFLALLLGIIFAGLSMPLINELAQKQLSLSFFDNLYVLPSLIALLLFVALSAGLYPALFLSGFKPIKVLGNKISPDSTGVALRKGLVIFQFTISIILIVSALTIYNQMEYVRNKNLGFDKEQVVALPYSDNEEVLVERLKQHPSILDVTISQRVPANTINSDGRTVTLPTKEEPIRVESYIIDEQFMDTYKLNLIAGRNIREELASDSSAFLINQAAVNTFGWNNAQEALGKSLTWNQNTEGTVVGVVQDFHMASLREKIEPLVMHTIRNRTWWRTFISARIQPNNVRETLGFIEKTWKELTPNGAFEYFFIDQSIQQLHDADQRMGRIFSYFAGLAILIACMGLFGLASFMAAKRKREVGIRKVFGAEVENIVLLLSKDFLWLICVGFIIAAPLAYLAMNNWLQNFAYHIEPGLQIYLIAGGVTLLVSILAVGYQAVKAALMNPANSLRSE